MARGSEENVEQIAKKIPDISSIHEKHVFRNNNDYVPIVNSVQVNDKQMRVAL